MTKFNPNKIWNKKILIGYKTYSIKKMTLKASYGQDQRNAGLCVNTEGIIYIDPDQSDDELLNTLIHELLHASVYVGGLQSVLNGNEEQVVNTLGNVLTQVLQQNKIEGIN